MLSGKLREQRHLCEVRYLCSIGARAGNYLALVQRHRGKDAADQLRADAREQYRRGNRGRWGDWR
ncbi:DUF7696 family protein [Quisquiliibacterium transsilvanicum]|uniref:DUF7696 family protein n=1 Tax=Quisquiliibacterium transsilvanicum TaxID=1549638 RepID=UPI00337337E6